jgi:hypothetical protein
MDTIQKLEMYRRKAKFIARLASALTNPPPQGSSLKGIRYELYEEQAVNKTFYEEFIILEYEGDVECAVCVNSNSDSANLRVIASNINNGDYTDEYFYNRIKAKAKQVNLD